MDREVERPAIKSNKAYTMTSSGAITPIKTSGTFSSREKIGRRIAKCAIKSPMQLAQNDRMRRNRQWALNAYPKKSKNYTARRSRDSPIILEIWLLAFVCQVNCVTDGKRSDQ
jgi:hypothetical protein